jgi:hypothetical protein
MATDRNAHERTPADPSQPKRTPDDRDRDADQTKKDEKNPL